MTTFTVVMLDTYIAGTAILTGAWWFGTRGIRRDTETFPPDVTFPCCFILAALFPAYPLAAVYVLGKFLVEYRRYRRDECAVRLVSRLIGVLDMKCDEDRALLAVLRLWNQKSLERSIAERAKEKMK